VREDYVSSALEISMQSGDCSFAVTIAETLKHFRVALGGTAEVHVVNSIKVYIGIDPGQQTLNQLQ
jgi:hypothetical protein